MIIYKRICLLVKEDKNSWGLKVIGEVSVVSPVTFLISF